MREGQSYVMHLQFGIRRQRSIMARA